MPEPAVFESAPESLLPRPKRVEPRGGALRLRRGERLGLRVSGADARAVAQLERALAPLQVRIEREANAAHTLELHLDGSILPPAGYRLELDSGGARLAAGDQAGLFHAAVTLGQLVRAGFVAANPEHSTLPGVSIEDFPDFRARGFLLDVSRDRVPTMPALRALVERLAEFKYNQLQLYVEHTFAYAGHEEVWRDASPLTPPQVRALDAFCRERHIELIPNQQSFGHMHRWLAHARYRDLAECPGGVEHAFSVDVEPFSLCPVDPGSLALLADLYDQLLPCFASQLFHVGLDETFDLGRGRSRARCAELGAGRVYLEYLERVHALVAERGKRMQFWGDIIVQHPELVPELPADAIAMEWGYEAGHPFEQHAQRFADSGLEFHVCPGTSSWQSFAGRLDNARANLAQAAQHGLEAGAAGYLVTDWGDYGHWQPMPAQWPGLLLGGAHAWNAEAGQLDLAAALDLHLLDERAGCAGRALLELAAVHTSCDAAAVNGAPLFFLLRYAHEPMPIERAPGLNERGLLRHAERLEEIRSLLSGHSMRCADAELVQGELEWVIDVLAWAGSLGLARLDAGPGSSMAELPGNARERLAGGLRPLIERHRELWRARSRPGGLEASAARFARLLDLLSQPLEGRG